MAIVSGHQLQEDQNEGLYPLKVRMEDIPDVQLGGAILKTNEEFFRSALALSNMFFLV